MKIFYLKSNPANDTAVRTTWGMHTGRNEPMTLGVMVCCKSVGVDKKQLALSTKKLKRFVVFRF